MHVDIFTLWPSLPQVNHNCRSDELPLLSPLRPLQPRLSCLALLVFEVVIRVLGRTAA
jgi:hypothetical protein